MSLAFLGKKSFNPTNIKNQEKVWLAEKSHDEEQKRLAELQKQIAEEREIRELQELQGGTREDRIDWMYEGPMSGAVHTEDEAKKAEEYLLGKAFQLPEPQNEATTLAVTGGSGALAGDNSASTHMSAEIKQPTANEMFRRMHEDPLLRMRQAEKSSKASILANPIKMRKIHMEADAIARAAQKKAKKLEKAAKKARKKEKKEEKRRKTEATRDDRKRQRYSSESSSGNEDNCGGNVRRESSNHRSKRHHHKHHESAARKSSECTHHRLEKGNRSSYLKMEEREEEEYRRSHHDRGIQHERRRQHSGHHHHDDMEMRRTTTTGGRHLAHDENKNGERHYSGRNVKAVTKEEDGRDSRYGLMNGTKKESYKCKDLGPDEDLLRKSTEKAKAEEAEKAAARARKNTQMTHKEKVALAKEMQTDGHKHEMYTIQKSKEYDERRKRDEETEIKMRRGGEESKREKYGGRPGGNFLNEIEKTALSSSTVQGRIAARKHYQQRDQDAENFMQR